MHGLQGRELTGGSRLDIRQRLFGAMGAIGMRRSETLFAVHPIIAFGITALHAARQRIPHCNMTGQDGRGGLLLGGGQRYPPDAHRHKK
jgi:hypothetical protein